MSAAGKRHMARIAALPCIVGALGWQAECSPGRVFVHHLREMAGGGQRRGDFCTIPVCKAHHDIPPFGVHLTKAFYQRTRLDGLDLLDAALERLESREPEMGHISHIVRSREGL